MGRGGSGAAPGRASLSRTSSTRRATAACFQYDLSQHRQDRGAQVQGVPPSEDAPPCEPRPGRGARRGRRPPTRPRRRPAHRALPRRPPQAYPAGEAASVALAAASAAGAGSGSGRGGAGAELRLQAVHELAEQLVADVLHDAAAELAGLPVISRSVTHLDAVESSRRDQLRVTARRPCRSRAVLALGLDRPRFAPPRPARRTCRCRCTQRDRPELDLAGPEVVAVDLGDDGAGEARATASMSLKVAQVSSTAAGTVKPWVRSIRDSRSCGREDRPPGQHRGQVPAVVGVAVDVATRVRASAAAARPPRTASSVAG